MNTAKEFTAQALQVLQSRYLQRNEAGIVIESPSQLFRRVAHHVASAENKWGGMQAAALWEERFYTLMIGHRFLPNSPTLMNAGTEGGQLSACFVLPVEDRMEDIFSTLRKAALIQQSGGGTGFNFSALRPANDPVKGTGCIASGPVAYMKVFDAATHCIRQGGKRRGANMGILNISHPDIAAFIGCKRESGSLSNFNISVGIPDTFMHALEKKEQWNLIHPGTGNQVSSMPATALWQLMLESATASGDPGVLFTDTINAHNPTPALGKIIATNPCGEVPLLPFEPCNLGSVNLERFAVESGAKGHFDLSELGKTVTWSIRFLDDIIDVNNYLFAEISDRAHSNRKIGLGVMGWADALIKLGIPYDSHEAVAEGRRLMQFIRNTSVQASEALAKERGSFPNWAKSIYANRHQMRNATTNSIAPTGSIALIAGCSCSIEPLFGLAFRRKHVLEGATLEHINPAFLTALRQLRLDTPEIVERVLRTGSAAGVSEIPAAIRTLFKTAHEIPTVRHLEHQLAFQEWTDNAVSKTINLPCTATSADVDVIYRNAWKGGAKGITVYRDRSKPEQVVYEGLEESSIPACKLCYT